MDSDSDSGKRSAMSPSRLGIQALRNSLTELSSLLSHRTLARAAAAEYSLSGPAQQAPGRRLSGPSLRLGGSESVSLLLSARPVVVLDCRVLGHESCCAGHGALLSATRKMFFEFQAIVELT